jgi:argininosuccinate lyase
MPQKKNPDVAELGRGKTGRVYGNLLAMLTTMKGLPLAYNRDLQEDKEGLFDTVDTLNSTLKVFTGMINSLKVKSDVMISSLNEGYLLATDIADYLVKKGETFRKAHAAMGKLVRWAIENKKTFSEISIDEYKKYSSLFEDDVYLITTQSALEARNNIGDTSPEQVKKALKAAKIKLSKTNFV